MRTTLALTTALVLGCSAGETPRPQLVPYEPEVGTPERIAWESGITRHLGAAAPRSESVSGDSTTFEFDPADGPVCMRGAPFRASVRETDSDDLLIFLQGGGACWSAFCLAVTTAPPGIPRTDLLRSDAENAVSGWDVLYVPYCDASLFAGERDFDEDGDGRPDRLHHGLANLSAALTAGYTRFPAPRRIVLAGSSGGGYGTILATFLVRYVYPGVPIDVLNDSGVGIAREDESAYLDTLIDDFGVRDFIPADCADCTADGHIVGLVRYLLDRDPQLRVAAISSWYDYVISEVFLQTSPEAYRASLEEHTTALHAAHPTRYRRFFYDGGGHTALLGDVSGIVGRDIASVELPPDAGELLGRVQIMSMYDLAIDGVTLSRWLRAMIEGDDARWDDRLATPGPIP